MLLSLFALLAQWWLNLPFLHCERRCILSHCVRAKPVCFILSESRTRWHEELLAFAVSFPIPIKNRVLSIIYIQPGMWFCNTPVFAPVTMMTFPVKSGMSSTLNLLWGGKHCEKIELISPMVSFRRGTGEGRELYISQLYKQWGTAAETHTCKSSVRVSGLAVLTGRNDWFHRMLGCLFLGCPRHRQASCRPLTYQMLRSDYFQTEQIRLCYRSQD